jgi:hypothetical protein
MKRMALAVGIDPVMTNEPWPPRSIFYADPPQLEMDERPFSPEPLSADGIDLLVTGGRGFTDKEYAFRRLDEIHTGPHGPVRRIIEGGAKGGDALARAWSWQRLGRPSKRCPADWDDITASGAVVRVRRGGLPYNANAGFARNQSMLDEERPDACLALPGGNGTADMVARCLRAGVPLL